MATTLVFNPITGDFDAVLLATATVQAWMASPSSANLAAAMTDETGSGALVFGTSPTFTTTGTLSRASVGATSTDGWVLTNPTAAAAGAQQFSPRLRLTGQGWKTTATAGSQTVDWVVETQPVQGSTNPTANLVFSSQINGAGFNARMTVSDTGVVSIPVQAANTVALGVPGGGIGLRSNQVELIAGSTAQLTAAVGGGVAVNTLLGFSAGSTALVGSDAFIIRAAAAVLQFGQDVNGAAVAQTIRACNGITGTDRTGGDFTLASGKGTGAGAVSSLIFQTPTVLGSGTTAQSLATRLTLSSAGATFTGGITTLGGATFHTTSSALTDGAGASAGTITNAPSVGNPTKWIGINDNGVTRYIPAW